MSVNMIAQPLPNVVLPEERVRENQSSRDRFAISTRGIFRTHFLTQLFGLVAATCLNSQAALVGGVFGASSGLSIVGPSLFTSDTPEEFERKYRLRMIHGIGLTALALFSSITFQKPSSLDTLISFCLGSAGATDVLLPLFSWIAEIKKKEALPQEKPLILNISLSLPSVSVLSNAITNVSSSEQEKNAPILETSKTTQENICP